MKKRLAITFVEILICLTIVAILAALLFPFFQSVKHAGLRSDSQQEMQQIALAAQIYRQDWESVEYGNMASMGLPADYPVLFQQRASQVSVSYPKPPVFPPDFPGFYYMPLPKEIDGRVPTWESAVLLSHDQTVLVCDPWILGKDGGRFQVWDFSLPNVIDGVTLDGTLIHKKPFGAWFDFDRWR